MGEFDYNQVTQFTLVVVAVGYRWITGATIRTSPVSSSV